MGKPSSDNSTFSGFAKEKFGEKVPVQKCRFYLQGCTGADSQNLGTVPNALILIMLLSSDWMKKETIPQVLQEQVEFYCLSSHATSSPGGSHDGYCKIVAWMESVDELGAARWFDTYWCGEHGNTPNVILWGVLGRMSMSLGTAGSNMSVSLEAFTPASVFQRKKRWKRTS